MGITIGLLKKERGGEEGIKAFSGTF